MLQHLTSRDRLDDDNGLPREARCALQCEEGVAKMEKQAANYRNVHLADSRRDCINRSVDQLDTRVARVVAQPEAIVDLVDVCFACGSCCVEI